MPALNDGVECTDGNENWELASSLGLENESERLYCVVNVFCPLPRWWVVSSNEFGGEV